MSPYWWNFHWISGPARSSKKTLELAELLCGARGSAHVNRIKIMWLSCRFAIKQVQRTKQTSMDPKTKVPPACCHWKSDRSDCRLRWLQSKRKTIRPRQNAAFWFAWLATTRWDLRVKNVYTYQQKWLWLKIGYPQNPLVYHQFSHTSHDFPIFSDDFSLFKWLPRRNWHWPRPRSKFCLGCTAWLANTMDVRWQVNMDTRVMAVQICDMWYSTIV